MYFRKLNDYARTQIEELKNADTGENEEEVDSDLEDDTLPSSSGRKLNYPSRLSFPTKKGADEGNWDKLGPIGYTTNRWRSKHGSLQTVQNLYLGAHVKDSIMDELARRLILAESLGGLPPDIDDDSLAHKIRKK